MDFCSEYISAILVTTVALAPVCAYRLPVWVEPQLETASARRPQLCFGVRHAGGISSADRSFAGERNVLSARDVPLIGAGASRSAVLDRHSKMAPE